MAIPNTMLRFLLNLSLTWLALLPLASAHAQVSNSIPYPSPSDWIASHYAIKETTEQTLSDVPFFEVSPPYIPFEDRPYSCYTSAPFEASKTITLLIQGGAAPSGISLWLLPEEGDAAPYELRIRDDLNYDWRLRTWVIPAKLRGKSLQLHVGLLSEGPYPQTIRFSEPFESFGLRISPHPDWNKPLEYGFQFILIAFLLAVPGLLMRRMLVRFIPEAGHLHLPIVITAALTVCYGLFWLHFISPPTGQIVSVLLFCLGTVEIILNWRNYLTSWWDRDTSIAIILMVGGVLLTMGSGMLYGGWDDPIHTSSTRYLKNTLPADNNMPALHAERILEAFPVVPYFMEQQSSDRPPLQASALIAISAFTWDSDIQHTVAGILLQSIIIPCLYLLLRSIDLPRWLAVMLTLVFIFTGNFLAHSFYTWPKLLPTACLIILLSLLYAKNLEPFQKSPFWAALTGTVTALAMLGHGGSFFALIPIYGIWVLSHPADRLKKGFFAFIPFCLLMGMWFWYQKVWDPPGDGMLKWHLAGYIYPTEAPFFTILKQQYAQLDLQTWLAGKQESLKSMVGDPTMLRAAFNPIVLTEGFAGLRTESFYRLFVSLGICNLGWLLVPIIFFKQSAACVFIRRMLPMWLFGVVFWWLVMFIPGSTAIHHGSFLFPVLGIVLPSLLISQSNRYLFILFALLHIGTCFVVWIWHPLYNQLSPDCAYPRFHSDPGAIVSMLMAATLFILALRLAISQFNTHKNMLT
jgi:hypothetical protein